MASFENGLSLSFLGCRQQVAKLECDGFLGAVVENLVFKIKQLLKMTY